MLSGFNSFFGITFFMIPSILNSLFRMTFENIFSLQNDRMLIHWAALGGHEELVKLLSDLGSSIDSKDDVGWSWTFAQVSYDVDLL